MWKKEPIDGTDYLVCKRTCTSIGQLKALAPKPNAGELGYDLLLQVDTKAQRFRITRRANGGRFSKGKFQFADIEKHLKTKFASAEKSYSAKKLMENFKGCGNRNNAGFIAAILLDFGVIKIDPNFRGYKKYMEGDWSKLQATFADARE